MFFFVLEKENVLFFVGVYGDVQRVKILFNKKDSALVQMREPAQAQLGAFFLLEICVFLIQKEFF